MIRKIIVERNRDSALKKNTTVVIAKIINIDGGRGQSSVDVEYYFNGNTVESTFYTYYLDSLRKNVKVRLLISKEYPDKYIKYIGVEK